MNDKTIQKFSVAHIETYQGTKEAISFYKNLTTFIFDNKFSGAHIETYQGTKNKTINFSKKLKHLFLIINDFLNTCNHFR